jgi:hypothetical protein
MTPLERLSQIPVVANLRATPAWAWLVARGPLVVAALGISTLALIAYHAQVSQEYRSPERAEERMEALRAKLEPPDPRGQLRAPPDFVKGIYVSAYVAGTQNMFRRLVELVDRTELNTMVIDLKDGYGNLAFAPKNPSIADHAVAKPLIPDLNAFTKPLREKNIWLIARVFVFQDPAYVEKHPEVAVKSKASGKIWRDRKGVPWVDPAHHAAWEYAAKIAEEAYAGGFDEVQFDYIRFPSDGVMADIRYPVFNPETTTKAQNMEAFFTFLNDRLGGIGLKTSVDLFGLVMWQHDYDLNIGQRLDIAAPHFDYISPMVYPSHYPPGFDGHANPADFPYEIIKRNMDRGVPLIEKMRSEQPEVSMASIRPWIQDFDLGADYDAAKVRAQMKATEDGGGSGWLIWNARNVYTESALLAE